MSRRPMLEPDPRDSSPYRCHGCGATASPRPLQGELTGHYFPPAGWDSEEYQYPVQRNPDRGWHTDRYWFCSRRCRGEWLIRTDGGPGRRP